MRTSLGSIEGSGILNWKDHENTNVKINSVSFNYALNLWHFLLHLLSQAIILQYRMFFKFNVEDYCLECKHMS